LCSASSGIARYQSKPAFKAMNSPQPNAHGRATPTIPTS
jgi:hypothetical protein